MDLCANGGGACVIRDDHLVMCWGDSAVLADGPTPAARATHSPCFTGDCSSSPIVVRRVDGSYLYADEIECANSGACARTSIGEVYCWGSVPVAVPGGGSVAHRAVQVTGAGLGSNASSLWSTALGTCASIPGNTGGGSQFGELDGASTGSIGVTSAGIEVGGTGAYSLCTVGGATVQCRGGPYEIGPSATGPSATLVSLPAFTSPVSVLGGGAQAMCALVADEVWCWGITNCGSLGYGTASNGAHPTPGRVGAGYARLWTSAFSPRVCARTSAGDVECWGQLACPVDGASAAPVRVPELAGARQIAPGLNAVCAIQATGGVVCAGRNESKQLGREPETFTVDPVFATVCITDDCIF